MRYTVYALGDPRDGSIRYIGCTKLRLNTRLSNHLHDSYRFHGPVQVWIQELKAYWKTGMLLAPVMVRLFNTEDPMDEYRTIQSLLRDGHPLLNVIVDRAPKPLTGTERSRRSRAKRSAKQ